MRRSRCSEGQIIAILKERQALAAICHKHGISHATFYNWRSKYGRLEVSDARRLTALDDENRRRETRHAMRAARNAPEHRARADGSGRRARRHAIRDVAAGR